MRKVLVIRFSSLGDVVLTAPVFHALRRAWPEARITALVKEEFADVLAANPDIDDRLLLHRGESLSSLIRRVRAEHFDVVVDLHSNLRSILVSAFSGAAQTVRYHKAVLARRLFVRWRVASEELQEHTLDRYMDVLPDLGIRTEPSTPENFLVIQTAFLGDAVLTTPLLDALQKAHPESRISIVCTPEVFDIFERHPAISTVFVFDKRGKDRSLSALWRLAQQLRAQHFTTALVPHRSFKSALLAWLARIPRRIGFSRSQGRVFLTETVPFRWGVHDADRNLSLLQAIGINQPRGELKIQPEPQALERVEERLCAEGIRTGDLVVGINAGSVWATKRWLPEGFATVADRLARTLGARVIFFGGPKDEPSVQAVLSLMKEKASNWVGKTSVKELIAGIARCNVFLTNDSGPMHIAVACQVPTVAIFGPTTRELGFFPYGEGHLVIEKNLPCRPCGLHGAKACPLVHFECMKTITPDEVFQAVSIQLRRDAGPRTLPTEATA